MSRASLEPFRAIDPALPVGYWREHFGVAPEAFEGHRFYQRHANLIWIARAELTPLPGLPAEAIGMSFLRLKGSYPKPTSTAAIAFGHLATRNVIDLHQDALQTLLARQEQPWPAPPEGDQTLSPGYVLLRFEGRVLGCGLWLGERLTSRLPKRWKFATHLIGAAESSPSS